MGTGPRVGLGLQHSPVPPQGTCLIRGLQRLLFSRCFHKINGFSTTLPAPPLPSLAACSAGRTVPEARGGGRFGAMVPAEPRGVPSCLCPGSWRHPTGDRVSAAGRQGAVTPRDGISLPSAHSSIPLAGVRSWQGPGAGSNQDLQPGFSTGPQRQQPWLLPAGAGGRVLWFLLPEQPSAPPSPANGNRERRAHTSRVT